MIFPGFGSSESTGFAGPVAAIQQPQLAKGATPYEPDRFLGLFWPSIRDNRHSVARFWLCFRRLQLEWCVAIR